MGRKLVVKLAKPMFWKITAFHWSELANSLTPLVLILPDMGLRKEVTEYLTHYRYDKSVLVTDVSEHFIQKRVCCYPF